MAPTTKGKGSSALESAAQEEATIQALLESLPRVSPHTLVQHRTELLPLYARAATRARLRSERTAALAQMLSCVKRPGSEQRRAVAETCASIGAAMGEERCVDELMTSIAKNCEEHKAETRRLLGVECLRACAGVSRRVAGMVLEELTRIATGEASATVRVAVVRAVAATLDADAGGSPPGESPPKPVVPVALPPPCRRAFRRLEPKPQLPRDPPLWPSEPFTSSNLPAANAASVPRLTEAAGP